MNEITAGQKYRHFKGGEYVVLRVEGNSENSLERVVVYEALYESSKFEKGHEHKRLLREFVGFKDLGNSTLTKRFELIE
jgi:hypothetical protein